MCLCASTWHDGMCCWFTYFAPVLHKLLIWSTVLPQPSSSFLYLLCCNLLWCLYNVDTASFCISVRWTISYHSSVMFLVFILFFYWNKSSFISCWRWHMLTMWISKEFVFSLVNLFMPIYFFLFLTCVPTSSSPSFTYIYFFLFMFAV